MWANAAGLACNRPAADLSGEVAPPFQGGQSPGVIYVFDCQSTDKGVPNSPIFNRSGVGPLSITFDVPPSQTSAAQIRDGNGNEIIAAGSNAPDADINWLIFNVVRADGQPDTGGDPPAQGPPYDPGDFTITPTVNYDDRDNNPQSFSPTIVFKPTIVAPNGEFTVPISIDMPDGSQLFGDFNLTTGDISIGGGNGAGDGVSGPDRELPEGQPPEENEALVGVRVRSTISSLSQARVTELLSSGTAPNLYVPRVASVLFRRESSVGDGWSEAIDVKTLDSVIYAEGEAVDYSVVAREGVTISVNAIVRPKCEPCGS
jgi:hypothetical protein